MPSFIIKLLIDSMCQQIRFWTFYVSCRRSYCTINSKNIMYLQQDPAVSIEILWYQTITNPSDVLLKVLVNVESELHDGVCMWVCTYFSATVLLEYSNIISLYSRCGYFLQSLVTQTSQHRIFSNLPSCTRINLTEHKHIAFCSRAPKQ